MHYIIVLLFTILFYFVSLLLVFTVYNPRRTPDVKISSTRLYNNSSTLNSFLNSLRPFNRYTRRAFIIRTTSLVGHVSGIPPSFDPYRPLTFLRSHRGYLTYSPSSLFSLIYSYHSDSNSSDTLLTVLD